MEVRYEWRDCEIDGQTGGKTDATLLGERLNSRGGNNENEKVYERRKRRE